MIAPLRIRRFLRDILGIALMLLDLALLALLPARRADGPRRLLLARLDRTGDFILSIPAAQRIIDAWSARGYQVVAVFSRETAGLASALAGIEEVLLLDRMAFRLNPAYRLRMLRRLRAFGASEAIHTGFSRDAALDDVVIRASGAPRRMGWRGDTLLTPAWIKAMSDRSFTDLFPPPDHPHDLSIQEALLERLGVPAEKAGTPSPTLPRTPIAEPLPAAGYYVLGPSASTPLRWWPHDRFAALARKIHHDTGLAGVVVGTAQDGPLFTAIAATAAAVPLIDLTGRTNLSQLAEVIAKAEFVIACDSAPVHLAAYLGRPSVCVVGGGHPGRFHPYAATRLHPFTAPIAVRREMACYGCNWICPYVWSVRQFAPCVAAVTVDEVWAELRQLPAVKGVTPAGHAKGTVGNDTGEG